jgi:FkbM family methyltransferase
VTSESDSQASEFEEIRLSDYPETAFLISAADDVIRPYVEQRGHWEPGLWQFIGGLLPPGARIAVGGGHVGLGAYQLWRACPDVAELVVFEPDSVNAALLALNSWTWSDCPVRVMPMALGRRLGRATLARNRANTGDNRLWEGATSNTYSHEEIVVVNLDEVWSGRLDLLLLDTQGSEPDVLAGAADVIRRESPTIVFEWWPHALRERGFNVEDLLTWIERELRMTIEVVPTHASGLHESLPPVANELTDVRELTALLLDQPVESLVYVELIARPTL